MKIYQKKSRNVSIIGGADGPTSVFVVGKTGKGNPIERLKQGIWSRRYEKKRRAAALKIQADGCNPHTIEETLAYFQKAYQAVEVADTYAHYEDRRKSLRLSLIQRYRPELLGEEQPVQPPGDLRDQQAAEEWWRRVSEQIREREQRAEAIPEDVFPVEYHLFLADRGEDGQLEAEVESLHGQFSCSYAGKKEVLEPMLKDLYLYYGVSAEDIRQKTERYRMLEQVLSS